MAEPVKEHDESSEHYVYSTLTNDQAYTNHRPGYQDNLMIADEPVYIKGGSSVADGKTLITPYGVMTKVTGTQLNQLQANSDFKLHIRNGFIHVADHEVSPKVATEGMELRDQSSPKVDADFEVSPTDENGLTVKTNAK